LKCLRKNVVIRKTLIKTLAHPYSSMKSSRIFISSLVALGATIPGLHSVHGQTPVSRSNFFLAPAPSDFSSDVGERPDGRGTPLGFISDLPVNFSVAVREGFDDNVFTTRTNKTSSWYTNFAAGVDYTFGGPRLTLNANLSGGVTYYYSRPGDKLDFNGALSLGAVYRASPRLTLTFNTNTAYLSQPDTNIVGGSNQVDGDYFATNTSLDAAYQWTEKFSTVTGYNFSAIYYLESSLNDTQSFFSQTIKQSFRYLLLPKTTIVAEYRANPVIYSGSNMSSFGNFVLVGFDQVFNPRLKWSVRAGVEQRFNDNPVDGSSIYVGPYGETNLSYQFGPSSTLGWYARYGTQASGITNVTQSQSFRTGLTVSHAFTRRLSASLGANFQVDYNDQPGVIDSFTETTYDVALNANFAVTRNVSLNAGYQFIAVSSPDAIQYEYTRNVAFVGVGVNF